MKEKNIIVELDHPEVAYQIGITKTTGTTLYPPASVGEIAIHYCNFTSITSPLLMNSQDFENFNEILHKFGIGKVYVPYQKKFNELKEVASDEDHLECSSERLQIFIQNIEDKYGAEKLWQEIADNYQVIHGAQSLKNWAYGVNENQKGITPADMLHHYSSCEWAHDPKYNKQLGTRHKVFDSLEAMMTRFYVPEKGTQEDRPVIKIVPFVLIEKSTNNIKASGCIDIFKVKDTPGVIYCRDIHIPLANEEKEAKQEAAMVQQYFITQLAKTINDPNFSKEIGEDLAEMTVLASMKNDPHKLQTKVALAQIPEPRNITRYGVVIHPVQEFMKKKVEVERETDGKKLQKEFPELMTEQHFRKI